MQGTGSNEPVVAVNERENLRLVKPVALHGEGVDDHLHQFLANADEIYLEDTRNALDLLL